MPFQSWNSFGHGSSGRPARRCFMWTWRNKSHAWTSWLSCLGFCAEIRTVVTPAKVLWVQQHREYRVWQKNNIKYKIITKPEQTKKNKLENQNQGKNKKQTIKNCGKCSFFFFLFIVFLFLLVILPVDLFFFVILFMFLFLFFVFLLKFTFSVLHGVITKVFKACTKPLGLGNKLWLG